MLFKFPNSMFCMNILRLVSFRMICEALLLSDKLTWKLSEFWCQTFALIRRIIGGVDYKVIISSK